MEHIQTCLLVSKPIGCLSYKIILCGVVLWHEEREYAQAESWLQQGRSQVGQGTGMEEDKDIFINAQKDIRERNSYELPCLQELLQPKKPGSWNLIFGFLSLPITSAKPYVSRKTLSSNFDINQISREGC